MAAERGQFERALFSSFWLNTQTAPVYMTPAMTSALTHVIAVHDDVASPTPVSFDDDPLGSSVTILASVLIGAFIAAFWTSRWRDKKERAVMIKEYKRALRGGGRRRGVQHDDLILRAARDPTGSNTASIRRRRVCAQI